MTHKHNYTLWLELISGGITHLEFIYIYIYISDIIMVYFSPKKNNYGILVLDKRSIIMVLDFSQKKKKKKTTTTT